MTLLECIFVYLVSMTVYLIKHTYFSVLHIVTEHLQPSYSLAAIHAETSNVGPNSIWQLGLYLLCIFTVQLRCALYKQCII